MSAAILLVKSKLVQLNAIFEYMTINLNYPKQKEFYEISNKCKSLYKQMRMLVGY